MVISHHPILFKPLKKLNGMHYVEKVIIKAIQNNILLYAIHTNMDNILHNGVNEEIAIRLGLKNLQILFPKPDKNDIGSGIIGELEKTLEPMEFLEHIKNKLECNSIKYTPSGLTKIRKVAICGGAGSFLIAKVLDSDANAFITSDVKYHEFFEAHPGMSIIDIGHYESEKFTIGLLYRLVTQKFSKFATHYTKINTNPVKYF
jgi:dinuclear metal center YbgI/SA1388 family protein